MVSCLTTDGRNALLESPSCLGAARADALMNSEIGKNGKGADLESFVLAFCLLSPTLRKVKVSVTSFLRKKKKGSWSRTLDLGHYLCAKLNQFQQQDTDKKGAVERLKVSISCDTLNLSRRKDGNVDLQAIHINSTIVLERESVDESHNDKAETCRSNRHHGQAESREGKLPQCLKLIELHNLEIHEFHEDVLGQVEIYQSLHRKIASRR